MNDRAVVQNCQGLLPNIDDQCFKQSGLERTDARVLSYF